MTFFDYIKEYFIVYWVLICIVLAMTINSIAKMKEHKTLSIYILVLCGLIFTLSILDPIKSFFIAEKQIFIITFITVITYSLNPLCILIFIYLSGQSTRKKTHLLLLIPLIINIVVFSLALFPSTKELVFYFGKSKDSDDIVFYAGTTILRFTSHIVSTFYLGYLIFRCIMSLKVKHITHAINVFLCSFAIVAAVLIETFFDNEGKLRLLTPTIAVCIVFYYLFTYTERAKYDPLTGLFSRGMYYQDLQKLDKQITGIIKADMNGLKYINNTNGHSEGDKALKTLAEILIDKSKRKMYVYRLSGDEFVILCIDEAIEEILTYIEDVKHELTSTKYSCSIGYSYRINTFEVSVKEMLSDADEKMLQEKEMFYKTASFERRKSYM